MNNDFDAKRLWWIVWILGAVLVVKILWVVAEWLIPLPVSGVDQTKNEVQHSLHYRYRLASNAEIKAPSKTAPTKTAPPPKASLSAYRLVGIYSRTGYAVVTLVRGTKSFVISSGSGGGEVEGFHLVDASVAEAYFKKGDTNVTLKLYDKKAPVGAVSSEKKTVEVPPVTEEKPKPAEKKDDSPIVDVGGTKRIDRSLIREYSENPEKIWKNIGLYEVKNEGKLDGFKVRFVRRGSPFEKLGLKRGDVIKSINGEPIVDYATPMRMLKSADSIDDLSLTIERNHEEQELKYEVK
jgi:general secretion pathway protein C